MNVDRRSKDWRREVRVALKGDCYSSCINSEYAVRYINDELIRCGVSLIEMNNKLCRTEYEVKEKPKDSLIGGVYFEIIEEA